MPKKKICNQEGEVASTKGPYIFLLVKVVGIRFLLSLLCSHQIFTKFPTCFQVFNVFPQHVPNNSWLYPIFFVVDSTLENLYIQPNGGIYNIFILGLSIFYFLNFFYELNKDAHHKKEKIKNFGGSHNQLILVVIYYHVKLPQQSLLSFYIKIHN
jgi:hypothetical protein